MFADPQVITVNSVAESMPRVTTGDKQASYALADETFTLDISHQATKQGRIRSLVRFTQRKVVADPLTSVNDYDNLVLSFVIDRPGYGFSKTEVYQLIAGLKTWLDNTASDKLYGQES
jgi:hypothetical protein